MHKTLEYRIIAVSRSGDEHYWTGRYWTPLKRLSAWYDTMAEAKRAKRSAKAKLIAASIVEIERRWV